MQYRQDMQQVNQMAGQAARKLQNFAQSFMKDLQGSY